MGIYIESIIWSVSIKQIRSMGFIRDIITLVFNIIFSSAYIIAWVLLAVALGDNKWIRYDKADTTRTGLADRYKCHAGLWENCCTSDRWTDISGDGSADGSGDSSDGLECHSLITIGIKFEPILLPGTNDEMYDFAIIQLWTIRVAMLIAATMPALAIIGGKYKMPGPASNCNFKLCVEIDFADMFPW